MERERERDAMEIENIRKVSRQSFESHPSIKSFDCVMPSPEYDEGTLVFRDPNCLGVTIESLSNS